jgi:hypothetical protein
MILDIGKWMFLIWLWSSAFLGRVVVVVQQVCIRILKSTKWDIRICWPMGKGDKEHITIYNNNNNNNNILLLLLYIWSVTNKSLCYRSQLQFAYHRVCDSTFFFFQIPWDLDLDLFVSVMLLCFIIIIIIIIYLKVFI